MSLVASQLIGIVIVRYVVAVEPLASAPADELVATYAPVLQRCQVAGIILLRYVLAVEPLASMPPDQVVATYAPDPAAVPHRPAALSRPSLVTHRSCVFCPAWTPWKTHER